MLDELVNGPPGTRKVQNKGKENHVSQRVRDWERERERLREISRLEEIERERDAELSDSSDEDEPEVVDITPELEKIRVPSRAGTREPQAQNKVEERRVSYAADLATNASASRSLVFVSEPSTPGATLNTTLPGKSFTLYLAAHVPDFERVHRSYRIAYCRPFATSISLSTRRYVEASEQWSRSSYLQTCYQAIYWYASFP